MKQDKHDRFPPPLKIEGPIVFGDPKVIQKIKEHEDAVKRVERTCDTCEGEGMITCPDCDGDGARK